MATPGQGTARDLNIGDEVRLSMPDTVTCQHCGAQVVKRKNYEDAFYQGRQNVNGQGVCDVYAYYRPPDCPHCGETMRYHVVKARG